MSDPDTALHNAVPGLYKPAGATPAAVPAPSIGTIADVYETGPQLEPLHPAGPDSFKPAPSWSEMFTAARPEALRATPGYDDTKIGQGYAPIVEALGLPPSENPGYYGALDAAGEARFGFAGSPSRLATAAKRGAQTPFGSTYLADRAIQESLIVDQIRARRLKDPGFLPGVPDTADGLHAYFEQQQAKKRAEGAAVLSRGSTFGRVTASLAAGGAESALNDPAFLPTMVIGGGGATNVVQAFGRDALINGILSAAQLPIAAHNMAENDEHMTAGQAATQVIEGAAIGGVFGGVVHLGSAHVPPALFKVMPESVQRRWAGKMRVGNDGPLLTDVLHDMDNRELSAFAKTSIGERMTSDERAAAHVLERAQDTAEASPFVHGPQGDGAHQLNLVNALQSIIDGAPRETSRGSLLAGTSLAPGGRASSAPVNLAQAQVPHDIVEFFKAKGLDDAHAYGIAAGIAAEARGGDHTAVNPTSGALGLGQWLGSRKAALLKRYGPNPTRLDQLEHLWGELNGGDAGGAAVLAAKDPASVLDAYIRKFMRPAAGAETMGDLERGMAALGRKGEVPEGGPVGIADDEAAAAARASEAEAPDYPILKRELFANDADWFDAQLGFYKSQSLFDPKGPAEPAGAPLSAETAAGPAEVADQGVPAAPGAPGAGASVADRAAAVGIRQQPFETDAQFVSRLDSVERGREAAAAYRSSPDNPARPLAPDELKVLRPAEPASDPLWLLGSRNATERALGREPKPVWGIRDRATGELLEWHLDRKAAERAIGARSKDSADLETLAPENVAAALRQRLTDQAALDTAADVRIDDPSLKAFDDGGNGRADQVESLEHDLRMQAEAEAAAHLDRRFAELGPAPKRPPTFLQSAAQILAKQSKSAGIRYRIDADDAISHGIDADRIYIDPKARYPVVKLQLAGIFAASKAPLKSKATPTKLVSLDWFGDRVDPASYGLNPELGRLEPQDVAEILQASIDKSTDALDRSDPNYQAFTDWARQHDALMALEGEPAHPRTGETLPEVERRANALRNSFEPVEPDALPGTHNIPNSAPAPGGGTRGELRVSIVNQLLAKPARAEREAHLVLGPPAAGKSSVAEPLAEATGSRLIDSDEAKALLPEYEDGVGAAATQEESARIAAIVAGATFRKGENMVLPVVGRTYAGAAARVEELVKAGYKVYVHLVDLPNATAVERAIKRFAQTGRFVPPDYIRLVGDTPRETYSRLVDTYKDQLGGYSHVSNDVPQGQRPRLVEASGDDVAGRLGYARAEGPGKGPQIEQGQPQGHAGGAGGEGLSSGLDAATRRYRLTDDGDARPLNEIFAELDADRDAVAALRSCATAAQAAA